MALTCNIDEQGVRMRRAWGFMCLGAAAVLTGLVLWAGIWWLWVIVGFLAFAGGFAVFEARNKWCALRAMGVKTKV